MDGVDPGEVASRATQEREEQRSHAKTVLEWFLADERLGEMYPRGNLITELSSQTDLDREQAASGVRGTVGDVVDPVQQVTAGNEKYVGVIEYRTYPDAGAYGYVQYHDRLGERKRVVCAKCVEEADLEENVSHATEGKGTAPDDCGWDVLLERVESHYEEAHDGASDSIEPGASLVSNTTIGGNTAFHAGNDGEGSGLDADTLDGQPASDIPGKVLDVTPLGEPRTAGTLRTSKSSTLVASTNAGGLPATTYISGLSGEYKFAFGLGLDPTGDFDDDKAFGEVRINGNQILTANTKTSMPFNSVASRFTTTLTPSDTVSFAITGTQFGNANGYRARGDYARPVSDTVTFTQTYSPVWVKYGQTQPDMTFNGEPLTQQSDMRTGIGAGQFPFGFYRGQTTARKTLSLTFTAGKFL